VVAAGLVLGAATSWVGWNAGKRPVMPVSGAVQTA